MRRTWHKLQTAPVWYRWPIKWLVFGTVTFLVLYPRPSLFLRNIRNISQLDSLPDEQTPALAPLILELEAYLAENDAASLPPQELLWYVEVFVRNRIPYAFDWEQWGVVDYVPTLSEVIEAGREDCDGRAILAAALLRHRGFEAVLVGDPRHMWVETPVGQAMGALGEPTMTADSEGTHIQWRSMIRIGPLAVGCHLFPLGRELTIVAAFWLVMIGSRCGWRRALVALLLLVQGLVVLRLAGGDLQNPSESGAWWGLLHGGAAVIVLVTARRYAARHRGQA